MRELFEGVKVIGDLYAPRSSGSADICTNNEKLVANSYNLFKIYKYKYVIIFYHIRIKYIQKSRRTFHYPDVHVLILTPGQAQVR